MCKGGGWLKDNLPQRDKADASKAKFDEFYIEPRLPRNCKLLQNLRPGSMTKQIPGLAAVNPAKTFTVGTKGYMIRQGDQIFLNWLNLWLEQMFLQGEVQKLEQQWLGMVMK
jgi:hypothetical protein